MGFSAMPPPDRSPPSLLPAAGLPLTAFEEFMFRDDRPSHPMVIVARFDFRGGPPPASLATAFAAALRHEPLLGARITVPRLGRPRWLPGPVPELQSIAADRADASRAGGVPPIRRLDPRTGPMLHALVIPAADGWSLVVAVHHAACDGLGLVGFMERWLLAAAGCPARHRPGGADAPAALRGRGRVAASWLDFIRTLPRLAKGLEGVGQFLGREVAALGTSPPVRDPRGEAGAATWRPAVVTESLDAGLVERLDARAARDGVTTNDLLMAALTTVLGEHLATARVPSGRDPWIRLATPMSLRTKSDYALPAVNRVSMVFLDRRPADRLDEAGLVRGLKDEMDLIRSHHLGHILPLSLEVGRWCPGGLGRATRRPRPQSTAVLSNLGRCFHRSGLAAEDGAVRVGPGRLTGWWIVPPVRPGTAVAAATHETGGRRTIAFHVDESRVRLAEARGWLDAMVTTLHRLATDASAPPPLVPAAVP